MAEAALAHGLCASSEPESPVPVVVVNASLPNRRTNRCGSEFQVGVERPIGDSAAVGVAAGAESRRFPCLGGFPCAAGALGDGTETGPEFGRTGCGQQASAHSVRNLQWTRRAMPRLPPACGGSLQAAGRSSAVFGSGCGRRRMESAAGAAPAPVLVLHNPRVFTADETQFRFEAFAVRRSRFAAVGRNDDIRPLAGTNTMLIDGEGMAATSGVVGARSHPSGDGADEMIPCQDAYGAVGLRFRLCLFPSGGAGRLAKRLHSGRRAGRAASGGLRRSRRTCRICDSGQDLGAIEGGGGHHRLRRRRQHATGATRQDGGLGSRRRDSGLGHRGPAAPRRCWHGRDGKARHFVVLEGYPPDDINHTRRISAVHLNEKEVGRSSKGQGRP